MNIIELIFKAITKDAEQNIKKVDSNLAKLQKTAKLAGDTFKSWGATFGIAAATLYGIAHALNAVIERGKVLNQTDATKAWEGLKTQGQEFIDTLLTIEFAGANAFDVIERLATGLTTVLKAAGVVVEMFVGNIEILITNIKRLTSVASGLTGGIDFYTQSMYEAEQAQIRLNHQTRIGLIWAEQITETYSKLDGRLKGATSSLNKQATALGAVKRQFLGVTQIMDRLRAANDAIREGDARALADALRGGGGGFGAAFGRAALGTGSTAGQGGRPQGGGMGGGMGGEGGIHVYIDGTEFKGMINKKIKDGVFKPTVKQGVGNAKKGK